MSAEYDWDKLRNATFELSGVTFKFEKGNRFKVCFVSQESGRRLWLSVNVAEHMLSTGEMTVAA